MLSRAVSIYIYALFILLMVVALLPSLMFGLITFLAGGDARWAVQVVVRFFWRVFLYLSPVIGKINIINPQNLNSTTPAVYMSTHQSSLDFVLLGSIIKNFITISNHPISDLAIFLKVPRLTGVRYMRRNNPQDSIAVFLKLQEQLLRGVNVFLFPEGTRNSTDKLLPFQKGAARLALQGSVAVVPVVISGSSSIVSKGSNMTKTLHKSDIDIIFLEPIYADKDEGVRSFNNRIKSVLQKAVDEQHNSSI